MALLYQQLDNLVSKLAQNIASGTRFSALNLSLLKSLMHKAAKINNYVSWELHKDLNLFTSYFQMFTSLALDDQNNLHAFVYACYSNIDEFGIREGAPQDFKNSLM